MKLEDCTGAQLEQLEQVLGDGYGTLLMAAPQTFRRTCGLLFLRALDEAPDLDAEAFMAEARTSNVVGQLFSDLAEPKDAGKDDD